MWAAPHIYLFFLFARHFLAEIGQQLRKLNLVTDIGFEHLPYKGSEAAVITGDVGVVGVTEVGVAIDGVVGEQAHQQEVVRASICRGSVEVVSFIVQRKDTIDPAKRCLAVGVIY